MSTASEIVLSVAIMHHPRRADLLPDLVNACAPLIPRVVTDPEPDGPPSPLRTAKRAWAAVPDGATHHLVLQDDVRPMPGFAGHLLRAVTARPEAGTALFVHGKSPINAYLVRRSAAAGAAWAPLSPVEWTPTLGLVLPAAEALGLAAHLGALPDELLDDDDFVTPYWADRGLSVLATVPHLIDHGDAPSLSGYDGESERFASVYDPHWTIPGEHWAQPATGPELVAPGAADLPRFAIEFRDSRCVIRFLRPDSEEPFLHGFGWDWHDWCDLIGVDRDRLLAGWPDEDPAPSALSLEFWAAGYLLGVDAARGPLTARGPRAGGDFAARVRHRMVTAWADVGLSPADRSALSSRDRGALAECGLAGLARGMREHSRPLVTQGAAR